MTLLHRAATTPMPTIFINRDSRLAFQCGQKSAHRLTSELVDQLQEQLAVARLELSQKEVELTKLKYEMAKREREKAFAEAPSPSGMVH